MCKDPAELSKVFGELKRCLSMLGLVCEASKCKLLRIGVNNDESIEGILDGTTPEVVSELRFLGLKIDNNGHITRWKSDFKNATWALWGRLRDTGLSSYPRALIKAYQIFI